MPEKSRRRGARPTHSKPSSATIIDDPSQLAEVASTLSGRSIIAFDTEFLRERTFFPQLGLIQLADSESVWLVDPLALSKSDLEPLLDIFTDPNILKVAHSAEQDEECLLHDYGIVAEPLLDTSVAAALTGRGDQIGLAPLLRKLLKVDLPKGHTRTNWLKRPLPEAMAEYAALDVLHLVELAERLLADLDRRDRRAWALKTSAELADPKRYESDGMVVAARLASNSRLSPRDYAVLKELSSWRDRRVRKADIPRRWLAEDQALLQLARAKPRTIERLADFRGLGARVRDYRASEILDAIERGLAIPDDQLEEPPRKFEPTSAEAAAVGVFKSFLHFLAQEQEVPLRYLMDGDTPLLLLRSKVETLDELHDLDLLSEGALEFLGEEILAILGGRRALKIEGGKALRMKL